MESMSFTHKCSKASCRSCGTTGLLPVLDLGMMPLSDGLLKTDQLAMPEPRYPLEMVFCPQCSLVQILETVPPERLFCEDYPYYSSFSESLLAHSRENALELMHSRNLSTNSLVVEVASNDGYLLKNFVQHGIPVLGIDPAQGPVKAAIKVGVPTLCTFFGKDLAAKLNSEGYQADVIIANNVLAHVADTNGLVEGLNILLKSDGVAVIEVPYVRDLIDHCEFDTIYHEHLCYFSVSALDRLFRRHDLYLNDVRRLPIHGGSLRLYVGHDDRPTKAVKDMLVQEHKLGVDSYSYFQAFAAKVKQVKAALAQMLAQIKLQNKRIAAYGAAAKGAILLNYVQAGKDVIDYVVDRNVHKQGRFMPGVHIPICDPARIAAEMPDYVLVLPWNFKDEIMSQQMLYRKRGGQFIIPIPTPEIVQYESEGEAA
jgi:SAM-dependent methyltransferase